VSIRPQEWSIIALLALCASSCGIVELGSIGQVGETADAATVVDAGDGDRWLLPIVVDPEDLSGIDSDVVNLAFHADDLACFDGAVLRPESVVAGWSVTFERVDDPDEGQEAVDPPVLRAEQVRVDCPSEDPGV
jgi:hypothetical protein